MANTGGSSPVPVQIITSANGQQVIEQVQSISPSMLQQQQHQEIQIAQQSQQQARRNTLNLLNDLLTVS